MFTTWDGKEPCQSITFMCKPKLPANLLLILMQSQFFYLTLDTINKTSLIPAISFRNEIALKSPYFQGKVWLRVGRGVGSVILKCAEELASKEYTF